VRLAVHRISLLARPRPHVLLTLVDDEGRWGHGEASPLPPFSKEDAPSCARALQTIADIDGARLGEIDDGAPPAEAVSAALRRLGRDLEGVPSARFALETALFDLVGQQRGLSIAACLGAPPSPAPVPVNALLFPDPLDTLADRAAPLAAQGFPALKIKLRARDDAGFERELAALAQVRERLPAPYEIRIDPNAAWPEDRAHRRLAALASIAPSYVEQPVAANRLHRLGPCAVPWAADESLALPDLVEPLLSARDCAAFVLKPAILGGLLPARALALRAQQRGIGVVVTHLMDGPVAMAAACELAVSLPSPPLACGLAPHDDLAAFVANTGGCDLPQLALPHAVQSSGGPGLGIIHHPLVDPWQT
jgi:L-alanine-DL-glutamate epimerase-like enolase superfamily enzyme